ncbi:hypothetical protein FOA52_004855 [Chlamydomonas sp. UWO 241]|nr:hypothetical protein FOA52_004855 [Chlamydomonas sp. UWO 241]
MQGKAKKVSRLGGGGKGGGDTPSGSPMRVDSHAPAPPPGARPSQAGGRKAGLLQTLSKMEHESESRAYELINLRVLVLKLEKDREDALADVKKMADSAAENDEEVARAKAELAILRREMTRMRVAGWLEDASGLSTVRSGAGGMELGHGVPEVAPALSQLSASAAFVARQPSILQPAPSAQLLPSVESVDGEPKAPDGVNPQAGLATTIPSPRASGGAAALLRSFVEGARRLSLTGLKSVEKDAAAAVAAAAASGASPRSSGCGETADAARPLNDQRAQALALQAQLLDLQALLEQTQAVAQEALREKVRMEARAFAAETERDGLAAKAVLPSAAAMRSAAGTGARGRAASKGRESKSANPDGDRGKPKNRSAGQRGADDDNTDLCIDAREAHAAAVAAAGEAAQMNLLKGQLVQLKEDKDAMAQLRVAEVEHLRYQMAEEITSLKKENDELRSALAGPQPAEPSLIDELPQGAFSLSSPSDHADPGTPTHARATGGWEAAHAEREAAAAGVHIKELQANIVRLEKQAASLSAQLAEASASAKSKRHHGAAAEAARAAAAAAAAAEAGRRAQVC